MLRVVAGLLREGVDGSGAEDVGTWQDVHEDLDQALVTNPDLRVDGYRRPILAFKLSVKGIKEPEKQLLAVLRHFEPVTKVATAVLEVVWRGVWSPGGDFKRLLKKLVRMNVVDRHQQDYYGFQYGTGFMC